MQDENEEYVQETMRLCSIPGCDRIHKAKSLCAMHYSRKAKTGTTDNPKTKMCRVPGCHQKHASKGMCHTHYQRKARTGSVLRRTHQIDKTCMVDHCSERAETMNLCRAHYGAKKRYGNPYVTKRVIIAREKTCLLVGCSDHQRARGLCQRHYFRALSQKKTGKITDLPDFIARENQKRTEYATTKRGDDK